MTGPGWCETFTNEFLRDVLKALEKVESVEPDDVALFKHRVTLWAEYCEKVLIGPGEGVSAEAQRLRREARNLQRRELRDITRHAEKLESLLDNVSAETKKRILLVIEDGSNYADPNEPFNIRLYKKWEDSWRCFQAAVSALAVASREAGEKHLQRTRTRSPRREAIGMFAMIYYEMTGKPPEYTKPNPASVDKNPVKEDNHGPFFDAMKRLLPPVFGKHSLSGLRNDVEKETAAMRKGGDFWAYWRIIEHDLAANKSGNTF